MNKEPWKFRHPLTYCASLIALTFGLFAGVVLLARVIERLIK